jgi:hypothetical protein
LRDAGDDASVDAVSTVRDRRIAEAVSLDALAVYDPKVALAGYCPIIVDDNAAGGDERIVIADVDTFIARRQLAGAAHQLAIVVQQHALGARDLDGVVARAAAKLRVGIVLADGDIEDREVVALQTQCVARSRSRYDAAIDIYRVGFIRRCSGAAIDQQTVPPVSTGVRRNRRSGSHRDGTVEIAGIDLKPGDVSRRSGDFGGVGITQDVDRKVVRCGKRVGVWAVIGAREDLARRDRRTDSLCRAAADHQAHCKNRGKDCRRRKSG